MEKEGLLQEPKGTVEEPTFVHEQYIKDEDVCTWDFDHRAGVEVGGEEIQVDGGRHQDYSGEIVVMQV